MTDVDDSLRAIVLHVASEERPGAVAGTLEVPWDAADEDAALAGCLHELVGSRTRPGAVTAPQVRGVYRRLCAEILAERAVRGRSTVVSRALGGLPTRRRRRRVQAQLEWLLVTRWTVVSMHAAAELGAALSAPRTRRHDGPTGHAVGADLGHDHAQALLATTS